MTKPKIVLDKSRHKPLVDGKRRPPTFIGITHDGVKYSLHTLARRIGVGPDAMRYRIACGLSVYEAFLLGGGVTLPLAPSQQFSRVALAWRMKQGLTEAEALNPSIPTPPWSIPQLEEALGVGPAASEIRHKEPDARSKAMGPGGGRITLGAEEKSHYEAPMTYDEMMDEYRGKR